MNTNNYIDQSQSVVDYNARELLAAYDHVLVFTGAEERRKSIVKSLVLLGVDDNGNWIGVLAASQFWSRS
jgi:hypothetical protein